jgi:hypothetical protein
MESTAPVVSASTSLTWTAIKFAILTAVLLTGLILMFTLGNLTEISKNFEKYRCNPLLIPFAGMFGYDAKENLNFCLSSVFNQQAASAFGPVYGMLGQFVAVITQITNATLGLRALFANFFASVNGFIGNVRDRIQAILLSIRMSFLRLQNLMGKVYGTMISVVFMGTSALTAGMNLGDNDLVRFMTEFCFVSDTPVQRADGSYATIAELKIGDRLAPTPQGDTPVVTSTLVFDGSQTNLVDIDGVRLSEMHYVYNNSRRNFIPAKYHPHATPTNAVSRLYCLNVSGNVFWVGADASRLLVADYDEHALPGVAEATQIVALNALNGHASAEETVDDYSLGLDMRLEFAMKNGLWKKLLEIQIGDEVLGGGKVLGLVDETVARAIKLPSGAYISGAQLLFNDGRWRRAAHVYEAHATDTHILKQIVTSACGTCTVRDTNGETYHIRDYREVALCEMEDAYEKQFHSI